MSREYCPTTWYSGMVVPKCTTPDEESIRTMIEAALGPPSTWRRRHGDIDESPGGTYARLRGMGWDDYYATAYVLLHRKGRHDLAREVMEFVMERAHQPERPSTSAPRGKWLYNRFGHVEITFEDGRSLYLQSDYDVANFFGNIGLDPEKVMVGDWDYLPATVNDDYYEIAEVDERVRRRGRE